MLNVNIVPKDATKAEGQFRLLDAPRPSAPTITNVRWVLTRICEGGWAADHATENNCVAPDIANKRVPVKNRCNGSHRPVSLFMKVVITARMPKIKAIKSVTLTC